MSPLHAHHQVRIWDTVRAQHRFAEQVNRLLCSEQTGLVTGQTHRAVNQHRNLRILYFSRVYSGLGSPSGSFKLDPVIPALKISPSSAANTSRELGIAFKALRPETTAFLWPHLLSCPTFNSNLAAPPSLPFLNTPSTSMLQGVYTPHLLLRTLCQKWPKVRPFSDSRSLSNAAAGSLPCEPM